MVVKAAPTVILGFGYFLTAVLGIVLTREAGGIASIWPPNAFLLAALINRWVPAWPAFVVCICANLAANLVGGSTATIAIGFAVINMLEVGIAFALIAAAIARPIARLDLWTYAKLAGAIAVGTIAAGFMAGWMIAVAFEGPFLATSLRWVLTDFVSDLLIVTPLVCWQLKQAIVTGNQTTLLERFALILASLIIGWIVFFVDLPISLYLFVPVFLWIGMRFGLRWLSASIVLMLCVSVGLVIAKVWTPPGSVGLSLSDNILLVQEFALLCALGLTPFAIIFDNNQQANATLLESDARFRSIYNATPVMLHSIDQEGRLVSVSDYWLAKMGYRRDEVLGRRSTDFLTEESRQKAMQVIATFMETGTIRDIEYRFVKKDGMIMEVLLSATAERDLKGQIVRSLAVIIDVTERNRAQRLLRDAIDAMDSGFVLFDSDMKVVIFNQRYNELLDRCTDLIVPGTHFKELVQASYERDQFKFQFSDVNEVLASRLEAHRHGDATIVYERHDGRMIEFKRHTTHDGGMVSIVTDVTLMFQAQDELRESNLSLLRANTDLKSFVDVASHDLKAPLRAISFLSQCVAEDLPDVIDPTKDGSEILRNLDMVARRTDRLSLMLDDLLTYARLGNDVEPIVPIDTSATLEEIASIHQPSKVQINVQPNMPFVHFRTSQFETVCRNMVSNAIKHHDRDVGCLQISAQQSGDMVDLHFRDDGPGIPKQHRDKVFELFRTLRSRDDVEGSGLGLSMVKRILELNNGRIEIGDNEAERGTLFTIHLSAANSDIESDGTKTARSGDHGTASVATSDSHAHPTT